VYVVCCLILTGCLDKDFASGAYHGQNDATSPTLTVSNITVDEGNEARLKVSLSRTSFRASSRAVSFSYSTQQDTAQEGVDFTKITGQLRFSANETEKYILVKTMTDGTYRPNDKKLYVAFSNPTNVILSDIRATVSITNQVEPILTIHPEQDQLSVDADAEVELRATLSRPSVMPVTANCLIKDISNSMETVIEDAEMLFEPGEIVKKIKIPTEIKTVDQLKKTLRIELSKPLNANLSDSVIADVTVKRPQKTLISPAPIIIPPEQQKASELEKTDESNKDQEGPVQEPATEPTNEDAAPSQPGQTTPSDLSETTDKNLDNKDQEGSVQEPATEPTNEDAAPSQPEQTTPSDLSETTDKNLDNKDQEGSVQEPATEPTNEDAAPSQPEQTTPSDLSETTDKNLDNKDQEGPVQEPATEPTNEDAAPSQPEQKTPSGSDKTEGEDGSDKGKDDDSQQPDADPSHLLEDIKIIVSYPNAQVNEGRKVIVNVTLDQKPEPQQQVIVEYQAVAVNDSAIAGEDFKNTVGQLIFNADNYSQPQTVEVSTYYNFANTEPKTLKIVFSKQASNTSSNQSISIINTQQPNTENTLNFKIKEFDKIKTFSFEWAKDPNASYYRLLEKLEGKNSYWPVARIDDTNTSSYEYTPALIALVGATYVLEACGSDDQCVWSNQVKTKRLINKGIGYFKASNSGTSDHFGQSVSLSADGKTLAVGAWREASGYKGILSGTQIDSNDNNDPHNKNTGAVYIFSLKDNGWAQQAYITPENVGSKDYFGYSVSLSANGDTLAVGATGEDSHVSKRTKLDDDTYIITGDNRDYSDLSDEEKNQYKNHGKNSGAVYTFKRLDSEWQKSHFIKPDSVEIDANFGSVVDLSADGKTLAVGARDGGGDEKKHGTAYIFSFKKTEWTQDQIFVGKNKKENDNFGFAVDLSGNGKVLAVGAYSEEDEDDINNNGGVAYIFRQNSNGTWPAGYERRFVGQKQTGYFGHAVGLNYQGDILAIGARGAGDSSVYIYTHTHKNSTWEAYQQNPLYAANGDLSDAFGASLSFSDDGTQLLVGASGESSGASGVYSQQDPNIADKASDNSLYANGAVYLFILSNSTWQQKAYIKPARHQENISKGGANYYAEPENDFAEITGFDQQFGSSLSLSGDGRTLAIGAAQEHSEFKGISSGKQDSQQTNDKFRSGAVYVY
jgi:hypothetical protein